MKPKHETVPARLLRLSAIRRLSGAVLAAAACVLSASAVPAYAKDSAPVAAGNETGEWLSEKHDGVFRIAPCGDALCGTLIGLKYGPGEPVPTAKDGRSECGLTMLTQFRPMSDEPGRWEGRILDPDTGNVYHSQIWTPSQDVLKLRGYIMIPIFGETQTWTRYHGTIGAACRMP